MRRAVNVKPMNNFLLLIIFDNGEERVFNCAPLLKDELYSQITDEAYFQRVHIDEMGMVCWDESTDINPFYLYENSEPITNYTFAEVK